MEKLCIPGRMEYMETVLEFINRKLMEKQFDMLIIERIDMAAEELFTNIVNYGYKQWDGDIEAGCEIKLYDETTEAVVELRDRGIPFNPLVIPKPDLLSSIEDRPIGGLGIYMVKEFMDSVTYRHEDGFNIITFKKKNKPDGTGRGLQNK